MAGTVVVNIQVDGRQFLGYFIRQFRSHISPESSKHGHTKRINPKFATESKFYHICVLQSAYAPFRHWSRSSFWLTMHASWVLTSAKQSIVHRGLTHLQTVIKVTFIAMLASLDMTQFEWFWWYLWPKIAFKMSQVFPTIPLDITLKKLLNVYSVIFLLIFLLLLLLLVFVPYTVTEKVHADGSHYVWYGQVKCHK